MVVKLLERGSVAIVSADSASGIAKDPNNQMNTASNSAQTVAAFGSLNPVIALMTAPMAATITTAKIMSDLKNGNTVSTGDVMAVTGNVLTFVGTMGLLAGATVSAPVVVGIGFTVTALGALANNKDVIIDFYNDVATVVDQKVNHNLNELSKSVGNTAINTHNAITNGINNTKNTFNDITSGKAFRDSIDKLAPKVGEAAINMDKAINEAMANGAEKVNNAMQKATDAYKTAEQKIADAYKAAEQALKDGVKTAEEAVKEATQKAEKIAKDLTKEISDTFKEISDELGNAFDKYRQAAEDAFNKWKQQAEDFFDDFKLPNPFDDLPDDLAEAFAKWAGINRSGFHYFYDPIVLDLDGDGIETIAYDKLKKAVFDHDGMVTTQRALFNHNNISILAINEEERWAA